MNKLRNLLLVLFGCFVVAILLEANGQVTKTTVTTIVPVFNTGQFAQSSGTLYIKSGVLFTNFVATQGSFSSSLLVSAASANENPMVRFTSTAGLPQLVLEDLDADDAQEPFLYFQSANNASQGRGYIGFADRSGTNLASNANILAFAPTGMELYGALTVDSVTITNNLVLQNTSASLPLFTSAGKVPETKSIVNATRALGIDRGTATISADGTVTNTFNVTFSSAPVVTSTISAGAGLTNWVTAITTTNCVFTTGTETGTVQWIAVGAP